MEMNLVMPNNYVELEQEEMMYVDGGFNYDIFWDNIEGMGSRGGALYLIAKGIKFLFPNKWALMSKGASYVVGKIAPIFAKAGTFLGPIGWVLMLVGAVGIGWYLGTNRVFY